ncbi:MAG TPA: hypothetical protein VFX11_09450, partial [Candidatus Kapabacteria bacterium]|nr:hypothetical protein [Candidatus Kapabacteria bacterium]
MDDIKLPEMALPEPTLMPRSEDVYAYTTYQMHEYADAKARAAVLADRERRRPCSPEQAIAAWNAKPAAVKESLTPEQEREAFEAWYERDGVKVRKSAVCTSYYRPSIQDAWEAWQARAAL